MKLLAAIAGMYCLITTNPIELVTGFALVMLAVFWDNIINFKRN